MEDKKAKTCCFTGHRPVALPWKSKETGVEFVIFKHRLRLAIEKAIDEGYRYFITGMAQGVDIIAAEMVIDIKRDNPEIKLECAIPCKNQFNGWNKINCLRYDDIVKRADVVTYVTEEEYTEGCMKLRNEYMVNNSSLVIAGFNGKRGGTKQTIGLAYKSGLKVVIIEP